MTEKSISKKVIRYKHSHQKRKGSPSSAKNKLGSLKLIYSIALPSLVIIFFVCLMLVQVRMQGNSNVKDGSDTGARVTSPLEATAGSNSPVANSTGPQGSTQLKNSGSINNSSSSDLTKFDEYDCVIGSAGYKDCRYYAQLNEFNAKCDENHRTAYDAYHASYNPIRASYDADKAAFQRELDDLVARNVYTKAQTYGIWNDFVHQRTQTFNAAVTPIYSTYTSTVDSLDAGGCKLYKYAIGNPTLPF